MQPILKSRPWDFFAKPEELLSQEYEKLCKKTALENWKNDLESMMRADSEGMNRLNSLPKYDYNLIVEINDCLKELDQKTA